MCARAMQLESASQGLAVTNGAQRPSPALLTLETYTSTLNPLSADAQSVQLTHSPCSARPWRRRCTAPKPASGTRAGGCSTLPTLPGQESAAHAFHRFRAATSDQSSFFLMFFERRILLLEVVASSPAARLPVAWLGPAAAVRDAGGWRGIWAAGGPTWKQASASSTTRQDREGAAARPCWASTSASAWGVATRTSVPSSALTP